MLKKEKLVPLVSTVLAFAAAVLVYMNWSPETLLQKKHAPVNMESIESGQIEASIGAAEGPQRKNLSLNNITILMDC